MQGKSLVSDRSVLEAALIGLSIQKEKLQQEVNRVRALLDPDLDLDSELVLLDSAPQLLSAGVTYVAKPKRSMSAATRRKISQSRKAYWRAYHKKRA